MKTGTALKRLPSKLIKIWYPETPGSLFSPLRLILSFLSLFYRAAVFVRNRMYDLGILKETMLPCKVVSIGNITVGGTGKTPAVIMLAKMLLAKGYRPAVLSRGYGGKAKSAVNVVSDGTIILMSQAEAGDEPIMIAKSAAGVPVITGPKRAETGRYAIENLKADVLILDDGFQHRGMHRDVDIVILDRERPFGNCRLLPGGPLREPPEALQRANLILWRDSVPDGRYPRYCELGIGVFLPVLSLYLEPRDIVNAGTGEVYPLDNAKGKKVCAFAGIASPASFKRTLETLGWELAAFIEFPDHYPYTKDDISNIREQCAASSSDIIVTTEKDGVRLTDFPDFLGDVFLLRGEVQMLPTREEFERTIFERLG